MKPIIYILLVNLLIVSCTNLKNSKTEPKIPHISPDYTNVTIPCNIAPLNFKIDEKGEKYLLEIYDTKGKVQQLKSNNGKIEIPEGKWKKLIQNNEELSFRVYVYSNKKWHKFDPFGISISTDSISSYIAYRTIDPGNILWGEMGIYQRSVECFNEEMIMNNNGTKGNCMNCHSFANYDPNQFLIHFRKQISGTFIDHNGKLTFLDTKTPQTIANATYPAWHPSGNYIAFSVNTVHQKFFAQNNKYELVEDDASDIVLYDVERNKILFNDQLQTPQLENLPTWSPNGKTMYYISGNLTDNTNYRLKKYNLLRIPFEPKTARFGKADTLLTTQQTGKSISFPNASPNGKLVAFCMADYGYFTIHNKEADIYILNLETMKYTSIKGNSEFVESYPSWSSNGKWLMFVSKRCDNMFSKPYFCHVDENGETTKAFVLPQKDPEFYNTYVLNFNRPEFVDGKIKLKPETIRDFITNTPPMKVDYDSVRPVDGHSGASELKKSKSIYD